MSQDDTERQRGGLRLVAITVADLRYDEVPATPEPLIELRHALMDWAHHAGLSAERVNDIALATHEAMVNAVTHAYPDAPGTFDLCASHDGDTVHVWITDRGQWQAPAGKPGTGRGLTIMQAACPELTITPTPHGTTVHLRWPTSSPAP